MNIEFTWVREDNTFPYIGDSLEALTGWTAEEAMAKPIAELVTPSTLKYLRDNYYQGPPDHIVPRHFPAWLIHKDGHEVCCHATVVCRYNSKGELAEAWGSLQCQGGQCVQNALLERWTHYDDATLRALERMAEACIA